MNPSSNVLPEAFLAEMRKQLSPEDMTAFLDSYNRRPDGGLRVNRYKISPGVFREHFPLALTQIPWIDNGFSYGDRCKPSHHPWHAAGLYYLQEASAMTPAAILPVQEGDRVLDLCAAPGGKATELAARLAGKGFLLANDVSNSRARALVHNLERFGIRNMAVCSEDSATLSKRYPLFFDKVLIDAPCSGEGMFRREPQMIPFWESHGPAYYSDIQKNIIVDGADMLRPGGMMVYSTCTFSRLENEGTIEYLLTQRPEMELVDIPDRYAGFAPGLSPCEKAVRIYPHRMDGEGHFVCLLRKRAQGELILHKDCPADRPLPSQVLPALKEIFCDPGQLFTGSFRTIADQLYLITDESVCSKRVRFLRTGLLLGTLKKNRFEPSQALAMAVWPRDCRQVLDLAPEDERIIRYLKGETIFCEDQKLQGYVLVCAQGYPLGWGKAARGMIKNKLSPAWRWQ